jgi:hypothetical protein
MLLNVLREKNVNVLPSFPTQYVTKPMGMLLA